jgi:hypothetical protein
MGVSSPVIDREVRVMSRQVKLTPENQHSLIAFIRAGAFLNTAAEAAGISAAVFEKWMRIGCPLGRRRGWKPHKLDTPLWRLVREAEGQARVGAEVEARNEAVVRWLTQGPGKDRPGVPGWSLAVRPRPEAKEKAEEGIPPEVLRLCGELLEALTPFPEARVAAAEALGKTKKKQ